MRTVSLCALAVTASLASCAPRLQTQEGETYQPKTQVGMGQLLVERVKLQDLSESTPATSYVEYLDCVNVVISVEGVRKLGIEQARKVCQDTSRSILRGAGTLAGIVLLFSIVAAYFVLQFIQVITGGSV